MVGHSVARPCGVLYREKIEGGFAYLYVNAVFGIEKRACAIAENIGAGLDGAVGYHEIRRSAFFLSRGFFGFRRHHITNRLSALFIGESAPYTEDAKIFFLARIGGERGRSAYRHPNSKEKYIYKTPMFSHGGKVWVKPTDSGTVSPFN
jgi:hypothetical protein